MRSSGDKKTGKEGHLRSVAKAFSWRVIGTLDTFVISYILTGQFDIAASIGLIEVVTKTILYYAHERAWNWFSLGYKKGVQAK